MTIIGINASPRNNGNSAVLVNEVLKGAQEAGAQTEVFHLDSMNINGCKACGACHRSKELFCVQKDDMQSLYHALDDADGIVIGSPVYMALPSAQAVLFLNRLYGLRYNDDKGQPHDKIAPKKVVTVYAQGAPMPDYYTTNFDIVDGGFGKMLQTKVLKRIVCAGTFDEALIAEAREAGKALAQD